MNAVSPTAGHEPPGGRLISVDVAAYANWLEYQQLVKNVLTPLKKMLLPTALVGGAESA